MAGDRTVFVRLKADISDYQAKMAAAGTATSGFAKNLNDADQRLGGLVQTGLALGPALVPLGAAAVPAMAGLALQLGLAAGAAGVAVLAFKGVGTAIQAIDAAKLEPTAANIAKMNEAMGKLGPAGQDFAATISNLEPKLKSLRTTAEAGLFPGLTEGLDSAITLLPKANALVGTFASALGELGSEAGQALTGPAWSTFFDYIDKTARPVLLEMGQAFGNVIQGVATLVMDLDPLSRSFSSGLLGMSKSFATWATSVKDTQGFSDFIDYVQKSGPQALDAIGSIAGALIAVVKAAAPVGSVMLPVIARLADVFASLADSPIGPVLVGAASAIGILGRSMALLDAVGLKGGKGGFLAKNYTEPAKGMVTAFREAKVASAELVAAEKTAAAESIAINDRKMMAANKAAGVQFAMVPTSDKHGAIREFTAAQKEADAATRKSAEVTATAAAKVSEAEATKRTAMNETFKTIGKAGVVAAGLAVATTGVADKMGLSNTATLAMTGAIAGPWGAAVGGGIGLAMDFAAANNDVEDAVSRSGAAVDMASTNFVAAQAAISATSKATSDYQKSVDRGKAGNGTNFDLSHPIRSLKDYEHSATDVFTHASKEAKASLENQQAAFTATSKAVAQFAGSQGLGKIDPKNLVALGQAADTLRPKFTAVGVDMDKLFTQVGKGGVGGALATGQLTILGGAFKALDAAAGTSAGKSAAVGTALGQIGREAAGAADPVDALTDSLNSLFGIELDQSQATDDWTRALKDMRKQAKATKGDIEGNTKAALDYRDSTRSYVKAALAKGEADAKADHNGKKLASTLMTTASNVRAAGKAAGASTGDINKMLRAMGLTPKNLKTIIETDGALDAQQKVAALAQLYGVTPRNVKTMVQQYGAEPTMATVKALAKQYDLTPSQVLTLLKAEDKASDKAKTAKKNMDNIHDVSKFIRVSENASAAASRARNSMNIPDTYATIHINTQHTTTNQRITIPAITKPRRGSQYDERGGFHENGVLAFAGGGYGADGTYHGRSPQMVKGGANILWGEKSTGWEAYISGMPAERDRNVDILSMAAQRLGVSVVENARGGITDTYAKGHTTYKQLNAAMRAFNLDGGESRADVRHEFKEFAKHLSYTTKYFWKLEAAAEKVAKRYNDQEAQLKRVQGKASDLRSGAAGSFNNDIFGNGVAGLNLQLGADRNDANAMTKALARLRRKGLTGGLAAALGASGDLNTAQQLARMTPSQIAAESKLYASRSRAQRNLGQQAVDTAGYTRTIKTLNASIHKLDATLNGLEHSVEKGIRKGSSDKTRSAHQRRRAGR